MTLDRRLVKLEAEGTPAGIPHTISAFLGSSDAEIEQEAKRSPAFARWLASLDRLLEGDRS